MIIMFTIITAIFALVLRPSASPPGGVRQGHVK